MQEFERRHDGFQLVANCRDGLSSEVIVRKHDDYSPKLDLFGLDEFFGGWDTAYGTHFWTVGRLTKSCHRADEIRQKQQ